MYTKKDFLEEAMQYYKSLPNEAGLYAKYSIALPMELVNNADGKSDGRIIEAFANEIGEKTKIKFDAIISDRFVRNITNKVSILNSDAIQPALLDNKLFKSSEDKLAAFVNLNAKNFIFIDLKSDHDEKINLLFLNDSSMATQVMVNAEGDVKLQLLEFYASASKEGSLASTLHELNAGPGSHIEIDMLHDENEKTHVLGLCKASAAEKAKVRLNFVYNGGANTKVRNIVDSNGMKNTFEVTEIMYGSKEQKFDVSTHMTNIKPYSHATLESGAVLDGKSQCILKGFAKIENGAKGAFSRITERGILLSEDAHIDALPDMSIDYSNEVKATHSAATAPIDQEALFYLTSRGIKETDARKLFVAAFLSKYLLNMDNSVAKELAMSIMLDKLERGNFGVVSEVTPKGIWMASRN